MANVTDYNKNNKRIIALIVAMSLCFSMLSGCGSKPDYDTEVPPSGANEEVTEVAEAEESETEEPDTVPAGSVLFDDFDSVERTPLTKGLIADCEVYRIADQNIFIASTVKNEDMRDGGTSYTRKDGIESVLKEFTMKR